MAERLLYMPGCTPGDQTCVKKNIYRKIPLRNRPYGDFFSNQNEYLSMKKKFVQERGSKRLLYWSSCTPGERTCMGKNIKHKILLRNRPYGGFFSNGNR